MTSSPRLRMAAGSSALIDFTSDTLMTVSLAAPLETLPTVTEPDPAPSVVVAASLSPPQAVSPVAREATAVAAVSPRTSLLRRPGVDMILPWFGVRGDGVRGRGSEDLAEEVPGPLVP